MTTARTRAILLWVLLGLMLITIFGKAADFWLHYCKGNMQLFDRYQTFTYAYIRGPDNSLVKHPIKYWLLTDNDCIQVILTNDVPVCTHFSNVILTTE